MEKITSPEALKKRLLFLEEKRTAEETILKGQFREVQASLKPSRLILSTIKDLTSSSELKSSLVDVAMGWGAGSLSKKLITGASGGFLKQILGSVAETLVTLGVSKNAEGIKSAIGSVIQKFSGKGSPDVKQENTLNE